MQMPSTFNALIEQASSLNLYAKLISQLNKDFQLANIDLQFYLDVLPSSLKLILQDTVFQLLQERFTIYLNLLYIIDVAESDIKALQSNDTIKLAEDVSFLILKREWQKVWFRYHYI